VYVKYYPPAKYFLVKGDPAKCLLLTLNCIVYSPDNLVVKEMVASSLPTSVVGSTAHEITAYVSLCLMRQSMLSEWVNLYGFPFLFLN